MSILKEILQTSKVRFIHIKNYTNNKGEVANHLININFSYSAAKQRDIHYLKSKESRRFKNSWAVSAVLKSLVHPDPILSQAQKDAYEVVTPAVKIHKSTGNVMITGMAFKKTILVPIMYNELSADAEAKMEVQKFLRSTKYRNFRLDKIKEMRVNGKILEVQL